MKLERPLKTGCLIAASCIVLLGSARQAEAEEDFMVVALPDTQFYSQDYPEIYDSQTQWIADNLAAFNIKFVSHLGDVVNEAATLYQWANAKRSMTKLDQSGVPYGTAPGNHDFLYPGSYYDPKGKNYLDHFGPQFYKDKEWFRGASPSGLSNYEIVSAGGAEWLFLHLCLETPPSELAWAQKVLADHRDKATMISTHRYMYNWRIVGKGRYGPFQYTFEPLYRHDGITADEFYYNFVAANRQVYAVICGHSDGEFRQVSTSNFGLPVHEVLSDYQDTYGNGGNGWMRHMTFRPDLNRIEVQTYSSWLLKYMKGDDSEFTLDVNFKDYVRNAPFLRLQQGVDGYDRALDTWINEDSKGRSYGDSSIVIVDDDTTNGPFGKDYQGQGLFRFDDLVQPPIYEGDPEPTRIPLGSKVVSASMTLNLAEDTELGNPEYYVYRMVRGWDEGATWNSLGNGIKVGEDTDPLRIARFKGDNDPDGDYHRTFDVAAAVKEWAFGAANDGLAILPERLDFNDDGIEIRSSEDGTASLRPSISVEYTYDPINRPPKVTRPLAADPPAVDEGDEVELTMSATDPNPLDPLIFLINGVEVGFATGSGSLSHYVLMEQDGSYDFVGEVKDDEVTVPAGNVTVSVSNAAPLITELTPDLNRGRFRIFEFKAEAVDPGVWDVLTYRWDLDNDGDFDDFIGPEGWWWFGDLGPYPVKVEVSDGDGGFAHGQFTVTVWDEGADGDFDGDKDVDLADYAILAGCLAGPGALPSPPPPWITENCLAAFDFDSDTDVDLADAAAFSLAFHGD